MLVPSQIDGSIFHVVFVLFIQRDGWTALMHAAAGGHVNVLRTLIDNKADVNMLTEVRSHTHGIVIQVLYAVTHPCSNNKRILIPCGIQSLVRTL